MKVQHIEVDCNEFLSTNEQPVVMIKNPETDRSKSCQAGKIYPGTWYVANGVFQPGIAGNWAKIPGQSHTRVPLFSYSTPASLPNLVGTTALIVGQVITQLPIDDLKTIDTLHVAYGTVYQIDSNYQLWLGIAFRTR
jgi:hypothetical protein